MSKLKSAIKWYEAEVLKDRLYGYDKTALRALKVMEWVKERELNLNYINGHDVLAKFNEEEK